MIPLTRPNSEHPAPGLSKLTGAMSTPDQGSVTSAAHLLTSQGAGIDPHITFEQLLAKAEQKALEQEFRRLGVALGTIKDQSSALECALSGPS
jgi:hypothetical protein